MRRALVWLMVVATLVPTTACESRPSQAERQGRLVALVEQSEQNLVGFREGIAKDDEIYGDRVDLLAEAAVRRANDSLEDALVYRHDLDTLALAESGPLDTARDSYVDHLAAWTDVLRAIANGQTVSSGIEADINATWRIAQEDLGALDLPNALDRRVDALIEGL